MLVLRFLLVLGAIAGVAAFGLYLLTRDRRYLSFSWQIVKFIAVLALVVAAVVAMGRIVLL